jgi:HlyD family secretion protein
MRVSRRWLWIAGGLAILVALIVAVPWILLSRLDRAALTGQSAQTTVRIQPASAVIGAVSASGNIALSQEHYVTLGVDGIIAQVLVKPGDPVRAGDLLLALDTVELERTVRRAELNVQSQVNRQQQLEQDANVQDLAAAQGNLASALENLALVRAGPSNAEIAAARSNLSSTSARYEELLAGPSEAELLQLSAEMRRREVALAQAQEAYNAVAWLNSVGMTPQAAELQQATIDYETAVANFEQATAAAAQSEIQSALSSMQSAQSQLDDLLRRPTEGDVAAAEAQVAQAQANLNALLEGATETELRDVQISLEQSLVDLQEAYANLAKAQVSAPVDGTILTVDADVGRQGSRGMIVFTLADTTQLELTINVAEVDISQVELGQQSEITIDALPGQLFRGQVASIAPAGDASTNLVNYPVTIHLVSPTDAAAADIAASNEAAGDVASLAPVRAGMTAVATLVDTDSALRDGWLVPTSALREENGVTTVTVVRNGAELPVTVEAVGVQGEWTIVRADALAPGDEVIGTVTSHITNEFEFGGGPPGGQGGSLRGQ